MPSVRVSLVIEDWQKSVCNPLKSLMFLQAFVASLILCKGAMRFGHHIRDPHDLAALDRQDGARATASTNWAVILG
jgi:hypothetical protein